MQQFRRCALVMGWMWIAGAMGCAPHFTGREYIRHVAFLASDELEGRGIGTPGNDQAAEYIAWQFQQAGLKPRGENNTYFQGFEIPMGVEMIGRTSLCVAGAAAMGLPGRDFVTFPFSAMEEFDGPLAFAGYGITNADAKYDDYEGFDATGKVLLMFRYEPHASDPKARFGGETPSRYAAFQSKAAQAKAKGAKAVLIVNPPFFHGKEDALFAFNSAGNMGRYSLPMMHVSREFAGRLLEAAGADNLAALQRELDKRKTRSMDLKGLTARGDPGLVRRKIKARNVIAELRGQGPNADEYIVIGAHYDHLGKVVPRIRTSTRPEDADKPQIHNGADDNASGTAGVIELARAFAHVGTPDRSILFMSFTAEEIGLVGSRYYCEHPIVPLDKTVAMLNLDMIGRLRANELEARGMNSAPQFKKLGKYRGELLGLKIKADDNGYGDSDQSSFLSKQIPVLFFCTGLHSDYHMPTDDTEKINADGGARVVQLTYSIAEALAAAPERPTEAAEAGNEKKKREEPTKPKEPPAAPRTALKVRLGVMPSYAPSDEPGLLIQGATSGSPAEQAGLKDGDRILKLDGHEVNDVYGLMEAMKGYNPGDVATLVVLRGKQQMEFRVKFDANTPSTEQKAPEPQEPDEDE